MTIVASLMTPNRITIASFFALRRPLTFEYSQTTDHMGLQGYRYDLSEKTLGNNTRRRYPHDQAKYFEQTTTTEDFFEAEHSAEATNAPEEDPDVVNIGNCFCNGKCTPAGLLNVSACRYGAPVFASLPHFNRADPSLKEQVTGLNPDEEHDFFITLEPVNTFNELNHLRVFRISPLPYYFLLYFLACSHRLNSVHVLDLGESIATSATTSIRVPYMRCHATRRYRTCFVIIVVYRPRRSNHRYCY